MLLLFFRCRRIHLTWILVCAKYRGNNDGNISFLHSVKLACRKPWSLAVNADRHPGLAMHVRSINRDILGRLSIPALDTTEMMCLFTPYMGPEFQ